MRHLMCAALVLALAGSAAAQTIVLDESSCWRRYLCFDPSRFSPALLKSEGQKDLGNAGMQRLQQQAQKSMQKMGLRAQADWMDYAYLGGWGQSRSFTPSATPMPPADWASADFNDSEWSRRPGAFQAQSGEKLSFVNFGEFDATVDLRLSMSYYRGRFTVDDPAKAGTLTASVVFSGGARLLVNGTEIGRAYLPAGELDLRARAEDYPASAYQAGHESAQQRKLSATVPAKLLRPGVNILAVEIRAADMHPVVALMPIVGNWGAARPWAHCRLFEAKLRATGAGVSSGDRRPSGIQLWAEDPNRRVLSTDFLPPGEAAGALRIAGARNGTFAAQMVIGADRALKDLRLKVSDLASADGKSLPASCVRARWMAPYPASEFDLAHTHDERGTSAVFPANAKLAQLEAFAGARRCLFDHIIDAPAVSVPAGVSQAAWLSVRIPADAAPGTYKGTVTVEGAGTPPATLPVEVEVADWKLPDPKDFQTIVGCEENPYGVARQYGLKPWSEEHWKKMEASWALLGRVGNTWVNVPIIANTEFGNGEDSMVKWTKKGAGFEFDFRLLDRYLDMVEKHSGKPRFVHFIVAQGMPPRTGMPPAQVPVSAPSTALRAAPSMVEGAGALMTMGPVGSAGNEVKQAWQAFAKAAYDHMKSRGLEKSMWWGAPLEGEADPDLKALLAQAVPGVFWTAGPHEMMSNGTYAKETQYYKLVADIRYQGGWAGFRDDCGWKSPELHLLNPRTGGTALAVHSTSMPFIFRVLPERALSWGRNGFTRVGVDEWQGIHYEKMFMPKWMTGIPVLAMFWPGKDGAETSARFEMMLEGIQETEARIALEQALDKGRVSGPAAARAKTILDRRVRDTSFFLGNSLVPALEENSSFWQERSRELYRAAAEATR